jgi:deoxyribose-phosphate aldolase
VPTVPSSALPLTQRIDHTLLHPVVQPDEIARLCHEVTQWHFATVCVNSRFVSLAAVLLEKTGVGVCASVAFPFGAMSTEAKICEAQSAAWDGATEVDMVLPIGLLKAQRYREVFADILYVRQAVEQPARLRVALETGLLTTDNCYLGRVPLINSGGASGKNDLAEAVRTAVINKPAGATGFISGRKAFRGG